MEMDGRATAIRPLADQLVLQFIGVPETTIVPSAEEGGESVEQTFIKTRAIVKTLGPGLQEDCGVKVDDWVLFDGSNVIAVDLHDPENEGKVLKFGICGLSQILGIYEEA